MVVLKSFLRFQYIHSGFGFGLLAQASKTLASLWSLSPGSFLVTLSGGILNFQLGTSCVCGQCEDHDDTAQGSFVQGWFLHVLSQQAEDPVTVVSED